MSKKYYEIGQTFVDEKSGKTLRCVEGMCNTCFYNNKTCENSPECRIRLRKYKKGTCFIETNAITDQYELTQQLLLSNGWDQIEGTNDFEYYQNFNDSESIFMTIRCLNGFACFLVVNKSIHGVHFTTVGELKSIAKSLYKVNLEFK